MESTTKDNIVVRKTVHGVDYDYVYQAGSSVAMYRTDIRIYELSRWMQKRNKRKIIEMQIKKNENNNSYKALIVEIGTAPHHGADALQLGYCCGYQIVVGLDVVDGELGIFFPPEGQLSPEYAKANDLIGYVDSEGKRCGGYFGKNRRVRAITLRGQTSQGYFASISSLAFTGVAFASLKEGDSFDVLKGIPLCNKYVTPATQKAINQRSKQARSVSEIDFPKHVDTKQLQSQTVTFKAPCTLYVTEKEHGTSGRTGRVKVRTKFKKSIWFTICDFLQTGFWNRTGVIEEWKVLTGSRNVVLPDTEKVEGYLGDESFRKKVLLPYLEERLHKGEIVYYEIVGFSNQIDSPIMPRVSTKSIRSSEFRRKYGSEMTFSYGQRQGHCELHVYRIVNIMPDGQVLELPWEEVMIRCKELEVKHVRELRRVDYSGIDSSDGSTYDSVMPEDVLQEAKEALEKNENSEWDSTHIKEGVVVRIESGNGVQFLKYKSHNFYVLEGIAKDDESYVDLEEMS